MPAKKAKAYKMPPSMPDEVVTDVLKKDWKLHSSIGKGGFGEIYIASSKGDPGPKKYVVKIEPHENGPLFSELSFYRRVAKEERINNWVSRQQLGYLAVPKFISCGLHHFCGGEYRFMVMERYGRDLEKCFRDAGGKFCEETVCYLALKLLEALEFLHESEYVHADIKSSNLLTGYRCDQSHHVYLVDYGLATHYSHDGVHKEYKRDPKSSHNGTLQFTSLDAHNGVMPSRRSDLEILGYCLLLWASGSLPWEKETDPPKVEQSKKSYHGKADALVEKCFKGSRPNYLWRYISEVNKLEYKEKPQYAKLRKLFCDTLKTRDPTKTLEWLSPPKRRSDELAPVNSKKRRMEAAPVVVESDHSHSADVQPGVPHSNKGRKKIEKRRKIMPKEQEKTSSSSADNPRRAGKVKQKIPSTLAASQKVVKRETAVSPRRCERNIGKVQPNYKL